MADIKDKTTNKGNDQSSREFKSQGHILYSGTGTPYLAIFHDDQTPIIETNSGLPLSEYISTFTYKLDQEQENECKFTIDTGNPDTVDVSGIKSGEEVLIQYGYIFPDGSFESSKTYSLQVKGKEVTFDQTGTHVNVLLKDKTSDLRKMSPFKLSSENYTFKNFMDDGFDVGQPIIIEKYEPINVVIDESKTNK